MIECTLEWIERVNDEHNLKFDRVLDIGSRDTNGSPRHLFADCEYTGIDIKPGKGVDKTLSAYGIYSHFGSQSFDAVLCLYLFEHLKYLWHVLVETNFVLKPGGYLYVSVPTIGYPIHEHPADYWRFTEQAVRDVIMERYEIISLEHGKSTYGKHPVINCLGRK